MLCCLRLRSVFLNRLSKQFGLSLEVSKRITNGKLYPVFSRSGEHRLHFVAEELLRPFFASTRLVGRQSTNIEFPSSRTANWRSDTRTNTFPQFIASFLSRRLLLIEDLLYLLQDFVSATPLLVGNLQRFGSLFTRVFRVKAK